MHRKIGLVLVFVVIAGGVMAGAIFYLRELNSTNTVEEVPISSEFTKNETPDFQRDFDEIQAKYSEGNFEASLSEASLYAVDASNDKVSRLNMYMICMQSANNLGQTDKLESCYNQAMELAKTLPDANGVAQWQAILTSSKNKNGTDSMEATNEGPQ